MHLFEKEGLTYMDQTAQGSYVEALWDSIHFICLANEVGFARKNRPKNFPNIETAYSI